MAATENQALMVLKEEGAATPVPTPGPAATPLAFFVILKPGHASEGGQDQGILVANQEANMATTSTQATPAAGQSACAPSLQSDVCSTVSDPHPENLPPETVCKGVRVTLDNNNMWNEFYRCRTEMILTKQGRRMFPYCRFRISGMEPFQRYILVMDITPMDNHRYKWNGRQWETNGKAEPHVLGRVFIHPDSPSSGHYWMQNPVSFYKLKLTNNTLDQEGHVILHSMHRYLPRLHVVPADKATEVIRLNGPNVLTFTFPQTEFFAVTAYQNLRITQLKIDYNPFAKGFRDEGSSSRPKPDSSEMGFEIYRPPFGSEEQQTIKENQQRLDNNDGFDSFVMDKELFPSEGFDTEILDNGISLPKAAFADKDRSRRKRARITASSEAMQAPRPKLRRSVPEKNGKSGTSERTEGAGIIVKEEEEEVEVFSDNALHQKLKSESSAKQTGVQVEGPGNCKPVVADRSPHASARDPTLSLGSAKGAPETGTNGRSSQKSVLPAKPHEIIPLPQLARFLKGRNLIPRSKPKTRDISPSTDISFSSMTPTPLPRVSPPLPPDSEPMHNVAKPSPPIPGSLKEPGDSQENLETASIPSTSEPLGGAQADSQSSLVKKKRKLGARYRRHGKFVKRPEVVGGPTDVNMQPNLEDVEGLLFVSFTSKEALEIHLGDQSVSREVPPQPQEGQEPPEENECETTQEKIVRLEQELLCDLKRMRHRQVIHPVLQEVGLKLNLLDQTLPIDLQYLGVCLPLPPPFCPREDEVSTFLTSSPDGLFPFVSRTGKTTDYTKIKGWRDKFNITPEASSSKSEGTGGPDTALKNRSAFCSDMLDEYLANEGKLIDERAVNFSQSAESPVVYQMPTKSTSYVRTLDSVLKKQTPGPVASRFPFKSVTAPKKPRMSQRARTPARHKYSSSESKSEATTVSGSQTSTVTSPSNVNQSISISSRTKSMKTKVGKTPRSSVAKPAPEASRLVAPPTAQSKATPGALPDKVNVWQDSNLVSQCSPGQTGRSPGLSKMLLKLMDLEDGAVWEGKERTCVTEDRAAIALAALLTAQGTLKGSKAANRVIKRRAPPCLIDFCRLGCVCGSLAQEHRRFTHCGKPECMFGCTCLKRRVVLVKAPPSPTKNKQDQDNLIIYDALEEEGHSKPKKKKKKRMAYTISEPEQESEPAARVQTLWNPKVEEIDPEPLYAPTPVFFPWSQVVIRQESPSNIVPKEVPEEEKDPVYRYFESMMTCARVRPFSKTQAQTAAVLWKFKEDDSKNTILIRKPGKNQKKPGESQQAMFQSEPVKRLEIVSECPWEKKTDRNYVLRVICEYMAQNRLSHSFQIGPYFIKPVPQSSQGEDSTVTYKVCISQLTDSGGGLQDEDWYTELSSKTKIKGKCRGEGEEQTNASRSRVLPFLTRVSPAGLLIANKKQPGVSTQGHIKVNGKSYPQAKLQLGQMGALHPANRLAAYITGRLRPMDRQPSSTALSTTKSPNHLPLGGSVDGGYTLQLTRLPVNNLCTSTTTTTPTTATVAANGSSPTVAAVLKNLVAKPTVGKVFTQFVVNKFNSLQQKLPIVSAPQVVGSLQKVALPSGHLLVVGPSLPSRSPQAEQGVQGATASSTVTSPSKLPQGGSSVQETASSNSSNVHPTPSSSAAAGIFGTAGVINAPPITLLSVPPGLQREETSPSKATVAKSPGGAAAAPRMLLIPVSQAIPTVRPATTATITPGQKMILQPVRGTTGPNLYRHPSGQLVQLVPLSQLRTIQPNLVIRSPGAVVRLPTPSVTVSNPAISPTSANNPPPSTAVTKVITATSPTSAVNQSPTGSILTSTVTIRATSPATHPESPACSSAGVTKTTPTTVSTSPTSGPKLTSLSGATAFTLGTLPPSLKTIPGFLGQTGTYTVRIAPGTKESKVITLNPAGPLPNSPEVLSGQSGFTLLQIPKPAVTVKPTVSQVVITPAKPDVVPNIPAKKDSTNSPPSKDQAPEICGDKDPSQDGPTAPVRDDHSYTSGQDSSKESKASTDDSSFAAGCTQEKPGSLSSAASPTIKPCETLLNSGPPTTVGLQPPSLMVPGVNISQAISAVSAAEKRSKESDSESCSRTVVPGPVDTNFDVLAVERDAIPKACQEKRLLEEGEVEAEAEADLEVTGESEDLTDDSDEDSEDESLGLTMDPEESEEDEAVDIETVEELTEKINIARMKAAAMRMKLDKILMYENKRTIESKESVQKRQEEMKAEEEANVAGRIHHNVTERRRRTELRGLFEKLRHILGLQHMPKASKYFILKQANGEIQALMDQNDHLEEKKRLLNRQRATYIKKISQTSGKTEELIIKKLQDICAKQKSLEAQRRKKAGVAVDPKASKPKASAAASMENVSKVYSPSRRPNILSRKKLPESKAPPATPVSAVNDGSLVSGLNAVVSNQQILTVKSPLEPITTLIQPNKISGSGVVLSPVPGVASVTINVPGVSLPIQVKSPLPNASLSLSSQPASKKNSSEVAERKNVTITKIISVKSVLPSPQRSEQSDQNSSESTQHLASCPEPGPESGGDLKGASQETRGLEDGEVIGDQLSCNRPRVPTEEPRVNGVGTVNQEEEDDDTDDDPEDERLTSLLNEIAFLNQQMNSEDSDGTQSQTQKVRHTLQGGEINPEQVDHGKGHEGDDERSLSPLFLQLDEDLLGSTEGQSQKKEARAGADDLVKVSFGSRNQPENKKHDATLANGLRRKSPPSSVTGGGLTPPPLLQMKAGNAAVSTDSKSKGGENDSEVSWRPMPRLAPLGRKMSNPNQDTAASGTTAPPDPLIQHKDNTQNTT